MIYNKENILYDKFLQGEIEKGNKDTDYLLDFTAQLYEKIAELEERIERLEGNKDG